MTEASPAAAAVAAAGGAALLALVLLRRRRAIDEYAETFAAAARARNVEIARPREFLAKCARLREAGTARLQIVTDFDRTITMCFNDAERKERGRSSHGVIEHSSLMDEEYRRAVRELFREFYAKETDATLSDSEKTRAMEQWWSRAHELMINHKLRRGFLKPSLAEARLRLRPGVAELLRAAEAARVPVLVFSAGLQQIVELALRECGGLSANVDVVANRMRFADEAERGGGEGGGGCDDSALLVGFDPPLIHSMNKNFSMVPRNSAAAARHAERDCVLLLGDNPGDATMTNGLGTTTVLRVGFLNDNIENQRAKFLETFDAVVVGDGSMDIVLHVFAFATADAAAAAAADSDSPSPSCLSLFE